MKLLMENWRKFLILEAAKGPDDLPDDVYVRVSVSQTQIEAVYVDKNNKSFDSPQEDRMGDEDYDPHPEGFYGYVWASQVEDLGPCHGAYMIGGSAATQGYGPMLYDIAMELAGSKGLMPDRNTLSSSAYKVWEYYLKNRSDVTAKQLDDLEDTLTADEEDNCTANSAAKHSKLIKYSPIKSLKKRGMINSPVMKVYVKNNTDTVKQLKSLGKLIKD